MRLLICLGLKQNSWNFFFCFETESSYIYSPGMNHIQLASNKEITDWVHKRNTGLNQDNQFRVFYDNMTWNMDLVYGNLRRYGK